ncbi:uncharacterized protein LOC128857912 [Anastrepha ludens]|uniref:uncharacterized protein LOC128857912 n=1 Tax=Anastrepha ludens TaxID=28586 RepID=UPI0023B13DDE|nr:uncharacterized protein LOC128857912 [Anastrepha ludens]XP_053949714.1 uncharacterized protein LOC128857912 [Anastrepha ludens]XP_053949716.1 uncharacterized protein LOC128857912 [Anastrepha ludens]XP_053949717.1 uncharacterized protein LOC128857912 [Anastrepha ludens]XP_053949718.1 uncharacterized protein LOC128857912 [Anastrepha ludens]XP_053949719.1 uncharacterized protein LOC128857912 [Anastrepha ludens]XP_053949720.1 uncharacterized protein LOC128857912 [Anastrepha ludens]
MKVTVCFGAIRIVVPCGSGDLLVKDLINEATRRYKKAAGKVSNLQHAVLFRIPFAERQVHLVTFPLYSTSYKYKHTHIHIQICIPRLLSTKPLQHCTINKCQLEAQNVG